MVKCYQSLILTLWLFVASGCASAPPTIDHRVEPVIENQFCDQYHALLTATPLEIEDWIFFEIFGFSGYVNPITSTVHIVGSRLDNKQATEADQGRITLMVAHEYLHTLWFRGLVDRKAFREDYQKLRHDPKQSVLVALIDNELAGWNLFFNRLFFEAAELYSEIGEMVIKGQPQIPEYILRHYRGILKKADLNERH